eukprot:3415300-Prymnesium_polylepis.1
MLGVAGGATLAMVVPTVATVAALAVMVATVGASAAKQASSAGSRSPSLLSSLWRPTSTATSHPSEPPLQGRCSRSTFSRQSLHDHTSTPPPPRRQTQRRLRQPTAAP